MFVALVSSNSFAAGLGEFSSVIASISSPNVGNVISRKKSSRKVLGGITAAPRDERESNCRYDRDQSECSDLVAFILPGPTSNIADLGSKGYRAFRIAYMRLQSFTDADWLRW